MLLCANEPAFCFLLCAQGSKRDQEAAEARAAKKDDTTAAADKRDPKLPRTVPLPKDVSEVNNVHVATLLNDGIAPGLAAAKAAAPPQPPEPPQPPQQPQPAQPPQPPQPPAGWVRLREGQPIQVEVQLADDAPLVWTAAIVTSVLIDGSFEAKIRTDDDEWPDWFTWQVCRIAACR